MNEFIHASSEHIISMNISHIECEVKPLSLKIVPTYKTHSTLESVYDITGCQYNLLSIGMKL